MPGLTTSGAAAALTALSGTYTFAQLHDGDPGPDGAANVADETIRVAAEWPATVSTNTMTNDNVLTWSDVAVTEASQDYTHVSFWDAATGGVCGMTGTVTANPVSDGDTFQLDVDSVTVTLPVAS